MIEDYFIIDYEKPHSFCTACFARKVHEKGCNHKLQCCCRKRKKEFTLMKTQLIDGCLASGYHDFVIKEEDEELDPVRSYEDIYSNPIFFH